tara:strand:- start:54179 stop:54547 length:369 start_codon:yes stop_codon:yes gene_type:complete
MRVLGILFIFLNLASFLSLGSGFSPVEQESSVHTVYDNVSSELTKAPSFLLDENITLPNYFYNVKPAAQVSSHFFKSNAYSLTYFHLSILRSSTERNYRREVRDVTPSLTTLKVIFPHHYFT